MQSPEVSVRNNLIISILTPNQLTNRAGTSLYSVRATPTLMPPQRESILPPKIEYFKIYITTIFIYNFKITSYIKLINIILLIIKY